MDSRRLAKHPAQRRTGGRSARVRISILEATVDVLARRGYEKLSFDEVAERAGVSRTTVYRRWTTKQDLVRAALLHARDHAYVQRDTGSLRRDLLERIRSTALDKRNLGHARAIFRALMAESADPELLAVIKLLRDTMNQSTTTIIERAIARGELPPDTDGRLVLEPILGPVFLHVALFGEAIDLTLVERTIDVVISGIRARAGLSSEPGARR